MVGPLLFLSTGVKSSGPAFCALFSEMSNSPQKNSVPFYECTPGR
jgi:hypothetical protein